MSPETNRDDAERHIRLLTQPWIESGTTDLMEIRCLHESGKTKTFKFAPSEEDFFDDCMTNAITLNEAGWNIYVCVNPIVHSWNGAAADPGITNAYFIFADADDCAAAQRIRASQTRPDFYVVTGTRPTERLHAYWRVLDIPNIDSWTLMQNALITQFGSDPAIKNPSRIMRLAGTVAYPTKTKIARGYVPELTYLQEVQ